MAEFGNLIVYIIMLLGKLTGGAFAVAVALVISVPAAEDLEKLEKSPG